MNDPHAEARPVLAVIGQGESFSRVWPELAGSLGVALAMVADAAQLPPASDLLAVLVAVPGVEQEAGEVVLAARAAGAVRVAVVGSATEHRLAVAALRSGALEYFALPGDQELLRAWLGELRAAGKARAGAAALARQERERFDFSRLVGESEGLRGALETAARIIPRGGATVLITGETGTGKEVLAHAIHHNGPRSEQPFVEVNCTALPATLLEAELFGYEKGAFTDARVAKPGLFEAAHRGTLFLDEIGDLPTELQGKLLRVLEEKRIRRLGSVRVLELDVRIIAATNVELAAAVREGRFREDLFFRLNVVPIHLPPLRERGHDVLLLAERFLQAFAEEYDVPVPPLNDAVRRALLTHDWPGNVRELRNALERALLLGDGELRPDDLLSGARVGARIRAAEELPFPASLADIQRAAARRMVERLNGNKSAAADVLGISRTRLYRLLGDGV